MLPWVARSLNGRTPRPDGTARPPAVKAAGATASEAAPPAGRPHEPQPPPVGDMSMVSQSRKTRGIGMGVW